MTSRYTPKMDDFARIAQNASAKFQRCIHHAIHAETLRVQIASTAMAGKHLYDMVQAIDIMESEGQEVVLSLAELPFHRRQFKSKATGAWTLVTLINTDGFEEPKRNARA